MKRKEFDRIVRVGIESEIYKTIDKLWEKIGPDLEGMKGKTERNDCPVFLEEPKPDDTIWYSFNGEPYTELYKSWNHIYKASWDGGTLWRTEKAVTKYANNPAIYKLLQIIYRDYGGEPTEADWKNQNIKKFLLYSDDKGYCSRLWCYGNKNIGGIYMKEEPDVDKIISEMGTLMELLK